MAGRDGWGRRAGFTLVEIMVALCILLFGLLAIGGMQVSAIRGNAHARQLTQATALAQAKLEELMLRPMNHGDLVAGVHSAVAPPGFTLSWNVSDSTPLAATKTVVVTVTWQEGGQSRRMELRWIKAP